MSNYKTKEEALQSCLEVWQYLAETGCAYKHIAYDALGKKDDVFFCAACEFAGRNKKDEDDAWCAKCPIWDYRGSECECEKYDTPYSLWLSYGNEGDADSIQGKKEAAAEMVRLIESKIAANMTDRELLELAAKAAGIEILGNIEKNKWNSLQDDGDALRLAVKLRMDITFNVEDVFAFPANGLSGSSEAINIKDPYAATRRAITRAAADIGKEMK